ncbi:hypothetical protein EDC04DRAFT_2910994 [Pisolithus marmoratus]|nr:hypothetical protein EDC04DRAFT_2910994 [Pisolithus marmoratus]
MSQHTEQATEVVRQMVLDWLADLVVHSTPGESTLFVDDEGTDSDELDEFDELLDEADSYYDPILVYGEDGAMLDAREVGVNGYTMVDLLPEEALGFREKCMNGGKLIDGSIPSLMSLSWSIDIPTQASLTSIVNSFYLTSHVGTTGSSINGTINGELPDIIARIHKYISVPFAVGFGFDTHPHFNVVVEAKADGVAFGSCIVSLIKEARANQRRSVRRFRVGWEELVPQEDDAQKANDKPTTTENLWPSEPAGFCEAFINYHVGKFLHHLFALALDLSETYSNDKSLQLKCSPILRGPYHPSQTIGSSELVPTQSVVELSSILFSEKEVCKNHMEASESLSQETAALEAATHDINHIAKLINNRILSFTAGGPLCFSVSPHGESLEYDVHQSTIPTESNAGPLPLNRKSVVNQAILHHEDQLHKSLTALRETQVPDALSERHKELVCRICKELQRINIIKIMEWNRQVQLARSGGGLFGSQSNVVNTEPYFRPIGEHMHPAVVAAMFLVLVLSLLCGISRKQATFVLITLKFIISWTSQSYSTPNQAPDLNMFPRDYRTLLRHFDLDPHLRSYICCPSCFALYPDSSEVPDKCSNCKARDESPCGSALFRTKDIRGQEFRRPIRTYLHQGMKDWKKQIAIVFLPHTMKSGTFTKPEFCSRSLEPDGRPFMSCTNGALRLVFSLGVDGFNAFGKKAGGGPASVTAIYMACLSLPIEECFKRENIYLVGVIPGPHKPSEDEINHLLRPLVDDLLEFWNPGIHLSRTENHPSGCHVQVVLIPLVSNILAAHEIENFDLETWPLRTGEDHRLHANVWKDARMITERQGITKKYGVRFSELLHLPYWDPVQFTVVDSMHAFFLRVIPEHIRRIWGVNVDAVSGDGHYAPGFQPPDRPSNDTLIDALEHLQAANGSSSSSAAEQKLTLLGRQVLWYLCELFDLRRAGSPIMLSRTLLAWYRDSGAARREDSRDESEMSESSDTPSDAATVSRNMSLLTDTSGSTNIASSAGSATSMGTNGPTVMCIVGKGDRRNRNGPPSTEELEYARKRLQSAKSTHALGNNIRSATLFALCKELQICVDCDKPGKLPNKSTLLTRLGSRTANIESNPHWTKSLPATTDRAQNKSKRHARKSVVLGDQILREVWDDQQKLILPTFISPAPANFGLANRSLSADQWRSVGTIHLVITLIRLWGFDTGRKGKMLVNYIHLVTAIHWANMHTTSKSTAEEYMFHMLEYLRGLHFTLATCLLAFSPVHSWRTWAFERYNYMLQNIKTNNKFGELELTFMNDACRAANLTAYMFSGRVQAFKDLLPAFLQAFYSDIRGTCINDILSFGSSSKTRVYTRHPLARGQQAGQDKDHTVLAMRYIQTQNTAGETHFFLARHNHINLPRYHFLHEGAAGRHVLPGELTLSR